MRGSAEQNTSPKARRPAGERILFTEAGVGVAPLRPNRARRRALRGRQCLVGILGACWCGADRKAVNGDKAVPNGRPARLVLGHEGAGVVLAVGPGTRSIRPRDTVAVLPHVYPPGHLASCAFAMAGCHEMCVGAGHCTHTGFDHPGVMTSFVIVEEDQLVALPGEVVSALSAAAPDLPAGALGCFLEPILCVLCAVDRVRRSRAVRLRGARVLVIGAGHIGVLHALAWLEAGARVSIKDTLRQREILAAQICSHRRLTRWSERSETDFDLIVDTTGTAAALKEAFHLLADDGMIYLMAGLRCADRDVFDPHKAILLEQVHRHGLTIAMAGGPGIRPYRLSGHSGLRLYLVPAGIEFLAAHADALSRLATGVVRGFSSPTVETRNPLAPEWTSPDGEPAAIALLHGWAGTEDHISPIIVPATAWEVVSSVAAA